MIIKNQVIFGLEVVIPDIFSQSSANRACRRHINAIKFLSRRKSDKMPWKRYDFERFVNQIFTGDCLKFMKKLPDSCIDFCMTSPPYWSLRDYGVEGQIGLEKTPEEYIEQLVLVFRGLKRILKDAGSFYLNLGDTYIGSACGYGQKGEVKNTIAKTPPGYVSNKQKPPSLVSVDRNTWKKPKQLALIPSRVAIALQDDGWILRNDICWYKPNAMPSSVKDRLTNHWEHIFHLVKKRKYYYDLDAIREPHKFGPAKSNLRVREVKRGALKGPQYRATKNEVENCPGGEIIRKPGLDIQYDGKKRKNQGDVMRFDDKYWWSFLLGTSHSNRFLKKSFQLMKEWMTKNNCYDYRKFYQYWCDEMRGRWKSGSLDKGQSSKFKGALPFPKPENRLFGKNPGDVYQYNVRKNEPQGHQQIKQRMAYRRRILGMDHDHCLDHPKGKNPGDFWRINTRPFPGAHFAVYPEEICIRPIKSSCPPDGIVFDMFTGAGTTLVVAKKLGRKFIGSDINLGYVRLARERLKATVKSCGKSVNEKNVI